MHGKMLGAIGALAWLSGSRSRPRRPTRSRSISGTATPATSPSASRRSASTSTIRRADYEVVCTSQGSYYAAVQNTIAAFRGGKPPTIVQVFDVGTLDLMLSDAYYPAYKLMADNGYNVDWKNYFTGIRAYYASSKGDMFSFPFNSSTALLYWNKDAFKKIGKDAAPEDLGRSRRRHEGAQGRRL